MSIKTYLNGQRAYKTHLTANKLYDQRKFDEAQVKTEEALRLYESAVAEGCHTPRILMAYGVLLLKQSRFDEARELMLKTEKCPGITPDEKRQLRLNYAVCQWKLGRLDSAIDLMKRVAQDGKNSMIYGSLGYMLIEKARETGDFAEAEAFNQEAYEYDEEDAVTLDNLGQLALSQGKRAEALAFFERAIAQKPTQVDTLYYLAKLMCEDGQTQKANEYIDRALNGHYSALCTTTREQALTLKAQLSAKP